MKKVEIICIQCKTKIAEIKKPAFFPRDFAEYNVMFTCDCGAKGAPTDPVDIE